MNVVPQLQHATVNLAPAVPSQDPAANDRPRGLFESFLNLFDQQPTRIGAGVSSRDTAESSGLRDKKAEKNPKSSQSPPISLAAVVPVFCCPTQSVAFDQESKETSPQIVGHESGAGEASARSLATRILPPPNQSEGIVTCSGQGIARTELAMSGSALAVNAALIDAAAAKIAGEQKAGEQRAGCTPVSDDAATQGGVDAEPSGEKAETVAACSELSGGVTQNPQLVEGAVVNQSARPAPIPPTRSRDAVSPQHGDSNSGLMSAPADEHTLRPASVATSAHRASSECFSALSPDNGNKPADIPQSTERRRIFAVPVDLNTTHAKLVEKFKAPTQTRSQDGAEISRPPAADAVGADATPAKRTGVEGHNSDNPSGSPRDGEQGCVIHSSPPIDVNAVKPSETPVQGGVNAASPNAPAPHSGTTLLTSPHPHGQPPTAAPDGPREIGSIQVHSARVLQNQGQLQLRLGLHTDSFGSVQVNASVSEKHVALAMASERGDLKTALHSDLTTLQESLERQDLKLSGLRALPHDSATQADVSSGSGRQQGKFPAAHSYVEKPAPADDEPGGEIAEGLSIRV